MSAERRATVLFWGAAGGLVLSSMTLFWLIGYSVDPSRAATLRTPLDDAIPFLPWTVYLYSLVYTSMIFPLFVVAAPDLMFRTIRAYALVLAASLACFALFPVTSLGFRPEPASLPEAGFVDWAVRLTFFVDPPTNLFPSQHMSIAALSMAAAWTASRGHGLFMLPVVAGIAISICTMKQHYMVDGLAGLALAALAWFIFLRGFRPDSDRPAAHSWRGAALYVLFNSLFYLAFYLLYLTGYRPWAPSG